MVGTECFVVVGMGYFVDTAAGNFVQVVIADNYFGIEAAVVDYNTLGLQVGMVEDSAVAFELDFPV